MIKKKILNLFILKQRDNNKTQNTKIKSKYSDKIPKDFGHQKKCT
jgi:hypothetical protein